MKNLQSVISRIQLLLFGFINSILIILFSIAGCDDPNHTGSIPSYASSMLTHGDVDDYFTSIRGGTYCIYNDTDSSCIDLIPLVNGGIDTKGPIIHIYPERTLYVFYHEGKPLVQAERIGDTTDFVETLTEADQDPTNKGPHTPGRNDDDNNNGGNNNNNGGNNNDNGGGNNNNGNNNNDGNNNNNGNNNGGGDNNGGNNNGGGDNNGGNNNGGGDNNGGNNGDNNGNNDDTPADADDPDNTNPTNTTSDGHGWLILIYYPEGRGPINPPTLSESKVTVTINGKVLSDEDITGFAQFIGTDGEKGIQFFYPTESAELFNLRVQMAGLSGHEDDAEFYINYLWHSK